MNNPFTNAAHKANTHGYTEIANRLAIEGRIVSMVLQTALSRGYTVSVNDGEDWTVKQSGDFDELLGAMLTTDSDTIMIRDFENRMVGWVDFIYGNDGYDVISDMSGSNDARWLSFIEEINAYIERIES